MNRTPAPSMRPGQWDHSWRAGIHYDRAVSDD